MAKWYPQMDQVKDASSIQRTLKQVLDQHYALQDQYSALKASHEEMVATATTGKGTTQAASASVSSASAAPRTQITKGNSAMSGGPTNTTICGLPVQPVDVQTLANGATLKFNKTAGRFEFS